MEDAIERTGLRSCLTVWGQWLRQYRHTRAPRSLQTALICREIAAEKLAIWHADLKLIQSAMQTERAERVARTELSWTRSAPDVAMIARPGDLDTALDAASAETGPLTITPIHAWQA
jgi:hypothetical protein